MSATDLAHVRLAAGLEEAARLLRDHPDLPLPYVAAGPGGDVTEVIWWLHLRHRGLAPDDQARWFLRIAGNFGGMGDWTTYPYAPEDCKGWALETDHLRLIVTYRLVERAS